MAKEQWGRSGKNNANHPVLSILLSCVPSIISVFSVRPTYLHEPVDDDPGADDGQAREDEGLSFVGGEDWGDVVKDVSTGFHGWRGILTVCEMGGVGDFDLGKFSVGVATTGKVSGVFDWFVVAVAKVDFKRHFWL